MKVYRVVATEQAKGLLVPDLDNLLKENMSLFVSDEVVGEHWVSPDLSYDPQYARYFRPSFFKSGWMGGLFFDDSICPEMVSLLKQSSEILEFHLDEETFYAANILNWLSSNAIDLDRSLRYSPRSKAYRDLCFRSDKIPTSWSLFKVALTSVSVYTTDIEGGFLDLYILHGLSGLEFEECLMG